MGALDRVTAAELVRNFGIWQSRALHTPIVVTHRGRETHLLTPYHAASADQAQVCGAEWSDILEEVVEAIIIVDAGCRIVRANRAAHAMLAPARGDLHHALLSDVIPGFRDSLIARYVDRALRTGEPFAGDVRSPFVGDFWLRCRVLRSGAGAALLFRDVTDELGGYVDADAARGMIRSLATLGHVGQARLSVRGMIDDADANLRDRIGASAEALRRVAFVSLIPLRQRARFHEAFETAIRVGMCCPLETELVGRTGESFSARLALTRISGPYAVEGAVAAASWDPPLTPPCAVPPSPR